MKPNVGIFLAERDADRGECRSQRCRADFESVAFPAPMHTYLVNGLGRCRNPIRRHHEVPFAVSQKVDLSDSCDETFWKLFIQLIP